MSVERESLLQDRNLAYEIRVCSVCREGLDWCPDDGEGMWPRAWCRGTERHLVIDNPDERRDPYPMPILVREVE